MSDIDLSYLASPAALFASLARKVRSPVVWTWCPTCQTQTDQIVIQDEDEDEFAVWVCLSCCQFHKEKKEKNEHT